MDQSEAAARLTTLTGTFRPAGSATLADLTMARAALAASLLHNPADLSAPAGDLRLAPAKADAGLSALVGQAAATAGPVPLAFRRSVPFQSVTNPDAVPSATAGMASETLGPFADANGQLHWVDIFFPIRQTWISRAGAATPFLLLPTALPFPVPATISLGAGSVWIASRLLAPSAPADGYTGLTISGGTITFTAVPAEVSGNLEVAAGETVTLTIKLNAPPGPTGGTGLGADGGAVAASFPAEVSFSFSPAGGSITAAADATLTAYGQTITMQWHAATPVYEPPLNQILVDFTPDTTSFTVGAAASPLFGPQGTAPVSAAVWALPVATAAPAQLGAAAGDGALAVLLGPGLNASWQGLSGGPAPLAGTFMSGAAGLLEVITTIGRNLQLAETITLWPETPQATRRSSLDLGFPQASPLFFASIASAGAVKQTEALACTTVITAHLDRPLGADGSRLGPTLPGSLLVFETPTASGVVLTGQAPQALPLPEPIAIALTNALVITMPAQSLLLVAGFTASATELISGSLLLGFGFLRLLPTLPDLGAAVRTGDTADGTSQRNVLLDRRPAPGGGQLSGSGATLAGPGAATWDRVMIQDLLAVLALPPNAPLSVLAAELLPELSPPADPLSGSLGQVRILRTSPLTPVPAIC